MAMCQTIIRVCAYCLVAFGMVFHMFNAVVPMSEGIWSSHEARASILWQFAWLAAGIVLMLRVARSDYLRWRGWSIPLLVVAWCALMATFVRSPILLYIDHARWLGYGPIALCPSRWILPALIVFLASFFSVRQLAIKANQENPEADSTVLIWLRTVTPLWALAVTSMLLMGRASFSAILLLCLTTLCLAAFVRDKTTVWGICLLGTASFATLVLRDPIRWQRLLASFSKDTGPHCIPLSQLCIQSGGWFGKGLGLSDHRVYIPNQTEMSELLTAFIGEQLGLITILLVAALLLTLFAAGIYLSVRVRDPYGRLLAAGVTLLLGFQSFIHFAVVFNWVSLIGVPLPFVSEMGSNACIPLLCAGILLSVAAGTKTPPHPYPSAGALTEPAP